MKCNVIFHAFVVVFCLFSNLSFSKYSFRNTIRAPNGLDSDQNRHFVCPDLCQSVRDFFGKGLGGPSDW